MYLTSKKLQCTFSAFLILFSFALLPTAYAQQLLATEQAVLSQQAMGEDFPVKVVLRDAGPITPAMRSTLESGHLYTLEEDGLSDILANMPETLSFPFTYQGQSYTLDLVRYELFENGMNVSLSSGSSTADIRAGAHYRGIVRDAIRSVAAISVFSDKVIGVIETKALGKLNLGPVKDDPNNRFIIYDINQLQDRRPPFVCGTEDLIQPDVTIPPDGEMRMVDNCVGVYLDCEHHMYQDNGSSVQQTVDKMTSIWNVVALLYQNEQITANISEIHVWDTPDSYATSSTSDALYSFRDQNPNYNGDLAHLISRGAPTGGGVAWVDQLCGSLGYAYSYIYNGFNQYPSYSWTIEVITHEMGHNLGSWHTHDCVWNGNNTAIDGCGPAAGYDGNGSCPDGPLPSSGTIMSYCHLVGGVGIDFTNGFGSQPGDLIRNEITNASCLEPCVPCETEGEACNDNDDCTINDIVDSDCNCIGTFQDSDGDGVCDADDQCPGFDDNVDADNDGIPDGCDSCVDVDEDGECAGSDPDDNDACNPDPLDANCDPCSDLTNDGFENGFGNWNSGGNDCQISNWQAHSGSSSVQLRDDSGVSSSMFTNTLNMSQYDEVTITFSYYPRSMDNSNEDFWLQYSLNGGGSYTTYEEWNYGDEFQAETWYDETVIFTGVSFTSNTRFRFMCDASANNDWVYIDDVVIEGCTEFCVPGAPCDDGNACTINDAFTPNCGCVGTFQDTDGDGVCDADDQCPGQDDGIIGTSCDDGDSCTENDVYNANCTCEGTLLDDDGDGVCNANDQCPGQDDALIGQPCDDGDPCTVNDTYDANCNCVGTPLSPETAGVTANPNGDAYVSAQNTNSNYGSAAGLEAEAVPPKQARESYLRFDLSGVGAATNATLRLYASSVENAPQQLDIQSVSNDGWDENSITWANKPAMGGVIASQSVNAGAYYDIDVTSYVLGELGGTASFGLTAGSKEIVISSKEGSNPPELVITEDCGGALQALQNDAAFRVYPNPANDQITLHYSFADARDENVQVAIFTTQGRVVQHYVFDFADGVLLERLSTRDLSAGTYMIKVTSGAQVRVAKLLIAR